MQVSGTVGADLWDYWKCYHFVKGMKFIWTDKSQYTLSYIIYPKAYSVSRLLESVCYCPESDPFKHLPLNCRTKTGHWYKTF
jgi:hypothetical protein